MIVFPEVSLNFQYANGLSAKISASIVDAPVTT